MRDDLFKKSIAYYKKNGFIDSLKKAKDFSGIRLKKDSLSESGLNEDQAEMNIDSLFPPEATAINFTYKKRSAKKRRITIIIPAIEGKHLFAGTWTALKIFWTVKEKYNLRPRILCTDSLYDPTTLESVEFIPKEEIRDIESWQRRDGGAVDVEHDEIFIATAWWTAYSAKELMRTSTFIYLIQDFEPGFYPWSYRYALAMETYTMKCLKIFNTKGLMDFLIESKAVSGDDMISFEPGINKKLYYPKVSQPRNNNKIKIIIYGRPEVPRNLFDLAILGLRKFLRAHPEIKKNISEIVSAGLKHDNFKIEGLEVVSVGKITLTEWAELARRSDVGLSLMYSPHPSYPPLEMVASGMVVVTNRAFNKDLSKISKNFISVNPNINDITFGLKRAVELSTNRSEVLKETSKFMSNRDWDKNLDKTIEAVGCYSNLEDKK